MGGWIDDLVTFLFSSVLNGLTSAVRAGLNWALTILSSTVFASPDVTGLPQVRYAAGQAQLVGNACMTVVVTLVGILAMTHGSVQDRYALKDLLPRMLIGFAAANLATPIVRVGISGANAVTAAMVAGPFTSTDSFLQLRRVLLDIHTDPSMQLIALVLQVLAVALLLLVIITWLGRIAALLVIAGIGPVALVCHTLPQTDLLARIWWRSLAGVLAVQVLQGVSLHLAVATLLTGNANLAYLGFNDPTGLLNMLIACYLLWLVIRIPKWVARAIGGTAGRGGSVLGYIVRVVVVQQLLGALGLRGGRLLRRGPRPGPGASGGRPPPTHGPSRQPTSGHSAPHAHPYPTGNGPTSGRPSPGRPPSSPSAAPSGGGPSSSANGPTGGRSAGTGWPATATGRRPPTGQPSGTGWPTAPPATPARPSTPRPSTTPGSAAAPRSGLAPTSRGAGVRRGR